MTDATNQPFSQNQAQQQQLTINFQNSSDPNLELRILNQVHSAGRQLGRISAVIEVLLDAVAGNSALASEASNEAVSEFRKMLADIEEQKRTHSTDYFIAQLEALKREDAKAYEATAGRLRAFLEASSGSSSP